MTGQVIADVCPMALAVGEPNGLNVRVHQRWKRWATLRTPKQPPPATIGLPSHWSSATESE
jgi:hypothetical protein